MIIFLLCSIFLYEFIISEKSISIGSFELTVSSNAPQKTNELITFYAAVEEDNNLVFDHECIIYFCDSEDGEKMKIANDTFFYYQTTFSEGFNSTFSVDCTDFSDDLIIEDEFFLVDDDYSTYYVDCTSGDNNNDGLSKGSAKKDLSNGMYLMESGDTLIVSGLCTGNTNRIRLIPDGVNEHKYTIIRAEEDYKTVFYKVYAGGGVYQEEAVINILHGKYIEIRGFVIKETQGTAYALSSIVFYNSSHCKLRKIGIKNGVSPIGEYAGGISISYSDYCLLEDVSVVGRMRYGIVFYGGNYSHHHVIRRAVVRWDYHNQEQPRSSIAIYGGYPDDWGSGPYGVSSFFSLQNSIVVDGNCGEGVTFTGGFSSPGITGNVKRIGVISLNNCGYGIHASEFDPSHDIVNENCVLWDNSNGIWYRHLESGVSGSYQSTIKSSDIRGSEDEGRGSTYQCEAKQNVVIDGEIQYITEGTGNEENFVNDDDSQFEYIIKSPFSPYGATIDKKIGLDSTLFDDFGYESNLHSESVWPFPYEDEIKSVFSESNDPPSDVTGMVPNTNNVKRGFCSDSTALYGGYITLTSYIWEYLGNPCPREICTGEMVPPVVYHDSAMFCGMKILLLVIVIVFFV